MELPKLLTSLLARTALAVLAGLIPTAVFAQEAEPWVLPGDHPHAAFIDSHNYAIAQGATAEWRKMEWVALDAANGKLYYAISTINNTMADSEGDLQVTENLCGAIYMAELDEAGNINSMAPVLVGGPYDESNEEYPCNPDAIANPDNLFVDAQGNLWIGEDTDNHLNNFLWMWNGTELKRFASVPRGGEVTGLRVEATGTVFMNVQHPSAMSRYPYNRGTVGVISGYVAGDEFEPIAVPEGSDARTVLVASGEYQVIARAGEPIAGNNSELYGQVSDVDGNLIFRCNSPDGNMFLPIDEAGSEGYLYTNYECLPGAVSRVYIQQNEDGMWNAIEGEMVDFSGVNGTWQNCGASVTPWNTALTSEEYPADNQEDWEEAWLPYQEWLVAHLGKQPNQYDYGYQVEITPAGEDGLLGDVVQKHYVMGRFSMENAVILPDNKTAYYGDDGTNRVLYKFVAAAEGDLSAGTLYAAKVTQDGDTLNLEWIELGSSTDAEIEASIRALDGEAVAVAN